MSNTLLPIIAPIVHETYGDGSFVQAGAEHIAEQTYKYIANPTYRSTHYDVHMVVWNFFPGGGTAELVADDIIAALKTAGYEIKEDDDK